MGRVERQRHHHDLRLPVQTAQRVGNTLRVRHQEPVAPRCHHLGRRILGEEAEFVSPGGRHGPVAQRAEVHVQRGRPVDPEIAPRGLGLLEVDDVEPGRALAHQVGEGPEQRSARAA